MNQYAFLMGFPRSGTTYLQTLLATQSKVVTLPETHFFSLISKHQFDQYGRFTSDNLDLIEQRTNEMMQHRLSKNSIDDLNNQRAEDSLWKKTVFGKIVSDYFDSQGIGTDNKLILEKTPDHIRHLFDIQHAFPKAKFICLFRHPFLAINSFYENLIDYRQPYDKLSKQWKESYRIAMSFQREYPDAIRILKFEDLVSEKESRVEGLLKFMGLEADLTKLQNYRLVAEQITHDSEIWKKANREGKPISSAIKIPWIDRLKMAQNLKKEMRELNYKIHPLTMLPAE